MKRLLWLRLVLCVLLVPQLALGAQLPLVVQWMATAPLQLTWAQSTAAEAHPEPLPNFPHAPAVQSTRTRQGEAQLAQAELDEGESLGLLVLVAEQAGGWGLTMNQEMVQHAEYLPSGELWQNASDSRFELARRFLFTGKELDIHTGLYDFGARQYDARQGQWLSPDPILSEMMVSSGIRGVETTENLWLYSYTRNNPVNLTDPNGKSWWTRAGKAAWKIAKSGGKLAAGASEVFGVVEDARTVVDSNASASDRVMAAISLASEISPVSIRDAKDAANVVKKAPGVDKAIDKAGEILGAGLDKAKELIGGKRYSSEKQALVDMAKVDKKIGVTQADMDAYVELNKKLPDPFPANQVRGLEKHPLRSGESTPGPGQKPHGHVGPVDHIPEKKEH